MRRGGEAVRTADGRSVELGRPGAALAGEPAPLRRFRRSRVLGALGLAVGAVVVAGLLFAGPMRGAFAADPPAPAKPKAPAAQPKAPAAGAPAAAPALPPGDARPRVGRLLRLSAPITQGAYQRLRRLVPAFIHEASRRGEQPILILELEPGRTDFGQAFDLAKYLIGPELNAATTVAYVPETLTGHAVLVALACDRIVMAEEAELGHAGEHEPTITPAVRSAYAEIARSRGYVPEDLALAMLDPALELYLVETNVSQQFVLAEHLEELRRKTAFSGQKLVKRAGDPGLFSAAELRKPGIVSFLAADRAALARSLGLPPQAVEEDLALEGGLRPVRIDIRGPITPSLVSQVQSLVEEQIRSHDVNFLCFWIDSPGGSPTESSNLANYLAALDSRERRTVAYIPKQCRGDAVFLAAACDQIVMHPEAVLGGPGAAALEDPATVGAALREVARRRQHPASLMAALVDPSTPVYRYTRKADQFVDFLTAAEARELPDPAGWEQGPAVNREGQPLRLDGEEAESLGLVRAVVRDFAEFKTLYGLESDPLLVAPGWATFLVDVLRSDALKMFLLLLGAAAVYAEVQSPGIGLGGFIATVCFVIFFWSSFLGGTAGWLEVLLFVTGVVCLLLEIFVLPGFGVFGLGGGLLILFSIILASQTFVIPRNEYQLAELRHTLLGLVAVGVGTVVLALLLRRWFPSTPMASRMVLRPPTADDASEAARRSASLFDHLLGREGLAHTPLVPGGKVAFDDELVDVIAQSGFIERGRRVRCVEVRGNRVVVEATEV